ncbi:RluA family pseudouridine synthase [Hydrogenophaga sp.]|uniref:RluA family pseudouridine synthase n=1 Tax=Hydrogenophaga sp. TaxID=1904254 RepID=UPI003D09BBC7
MGLASQIISTGVATPAGAPGGEADGVALGDDIAQDVETRACEVPAAMHGWRIDRALARLIPEFSRSYLQQLMADGAVALRGIVQTKPAARVAAGEHLLVELRPTQQAQAFVPQAMALDIVFEDADLLVVHKPAGLVVHPAAGHWTGTLLNGLLAHHVGAAGLPRAGIVHRLDKDTSGLMLVAKSRAAVDALVRAIAAREVNRQYIALAHGSWRGCMEQGVDQPIGRDVHNRLRMAVVRAGEGGAGKPAQTAVRLLENSEQACLVTCKLHTGRTHQIRVHMAWLGHPLVGDTLYGGRVMWGMNRQALHAARLKLNHPITGEALWFRSSPPQDMLDSIAACGLRYNQARVDSGFLD